MGEIGLMDVLYDLLLRFIETYDAKRGIPRPLSEPDLTARQAAFRCFMTAVRVLLFLLCGIGSAFLLAFFASLYDVESDVRFIVACGGAVAIMLGGAKAMKSFLPYEREDPPVPKTSLGMGRERVAQVCKSGPGVHGTSRAGRAATRYNRCRLSVSPSSYSNHASSRPIRSSGIW